MLPQLAKRQFLLFLVFRQHGTHQGRFVLLRQQLRQAVEGLRKSIAAKSATGRQVMPADARIGAHAATDDIDVDAEFLAQISQFVDITDAQRQHADDRKLGELGFLRAHHEKVFQAGAEGPEQRLDGQPGGLVVAAEDHRPRITNPVERLTLGDILGEINHDLFLAPVQQGLQLVGGADAEMALVDDQQRAFGLGRDLADNFPRRLELVRIHAQDVRLYPERGSGLREAHALVLEFVADQVAQAGLVADAAAH